MKIYQLTNKTRFQTMGYVVKADTGEVIVIDGGCNGNTEELVKTLRLTGSTVDAWFITHPHSDHFEVLFDIINNYQDLTIKNLYFNQVEDDFHSELGDKADCKEIKLFNYQIKLHKLEHSELSTGDVLTFGNLTVKVLSEGLKNAKENYFNNLSYVLKFYDDSFSMLFLGDAGFEGGDFVVENFPEEIKCDGVQLAHHGQQGVKKKTYMAIAPKYAFWPTPKWLFDNLPYPNKIKPWPKGVKGKFGTPDTISWLKELNVKFVTSFKKSIVFDTKTLKMKKY